MGAAVRCLGQLTLPPARDMSARTYRKKRARETRLAPRPLVSFVRKWGVVRSLPTSSKRAISQMRRSDFRRLAIRPTSHDFGPSLGDQLLAGDITSERHDFGASAPVPSPQKTGATHSWP